MSYMCWVRELRELCISNCLQWLAGTGDEVKSAISNTGVQVRTTHVTLMINAT